MVPGWPRGGGQKINLLCFPSQEAEQHLSALIHYPPLHLAQLGLHTSSFGPFSGTDRALQPPNITHVHRHAREIQEPGISLPTAEVQTNLLLLLLLVANATGARLACCYRNQPEEEKNFLWESGVSVCGAGMGGCARHFK